MLRYAEELKLNISKNKTGQSRSLCWGTKLELESYQFKYSSVFERT